MSGVGVFAEGAALETYFSAQESQKSPESPHVRSTRGVRSVRSKLQTLIQGMSGWGHCTWTTECPCRWNPHPPGGWVTALSPGVRLLVSTGQKRERVNHKDLLTRLHPPWSWREGHSHPTWRGMGRVPLVNPRGERRFGALRDQSKQYIGVRGTGASWSSRVRMFLSSRLSWNGESALE